MSIRLGKIDQLGQFTKFDSLAEFQHHMQLWLGQHKQNFSKCELVGLKWLVRFSTNIPGVCNESIGIMLKAMQKEQYDHSISRTTFKRMIKKASKLGIITVYETEKENGSQSANLYVFNRFTAYNPVL